MRDVSLIYNEKVLTAILDNSTAKAFLLLGGQIRLEFMSVFANILENLSEKQIKYLQTLKNEVPNTGLSVRNYVAKKLQEQPNYKQVLVLAGYVKLNQQVVGSEANLTNRFKLQYKTAFKKLTPEQLQILNLKYGLIDGKPISVDEIAFKLNITRPKTKEIETSAISAIRESIVKSNGVKAIKKFNFSVTEKEFNMFLDTIKSKKLKEIIIKIVASKHVREEKIRSEIEQEYGVITAMCLDNLIVSEINDFKVLIAKRPKRAPIINTKKNIEDLLKLK